MQPRPIGPSKTAILFSILTLLAPLTYGFRFPYKASGVDSVDGQQRGNGLDADLTLLLGSSPDSQSQVYTQALHLLDSLRASPSCNRVAASTLIHSCQSIDGSMSENEELQEDVKSIYAAQLAICEIKDAGSRPPGTCESFLPDKHLQLSRKLTHSSDQISGMASALKRKLGSCLQSLEARPQHWTSYSNNRQNAVVMCQAARIQIEKDNTISLHKSMVDTKLSADAALRRAVNAAKEAFIRQEEFSKKVRLFQDQVMRDLEASKVESESFIGSLLKQANGALLSVTQRLFDRVKDIESEANKVDEALQSSNAEVKELKSNIGRVFQQAVEGSAELAATQAKQWDATMSSSVELRDSLQNLREQDVHSLLGAFDSIHNQLRASNELITVMFSRQNEMDKRLVNLDKSFAGLESTAAALQAIQTADAESQLQLHNQVQIELQVAQGLLADITASAASLQATVQDTSSKVTNMVAIGGLSNTVLNWGWSLIMIFVLYQFHPKFGRYAVITLGTLLLISSSGPPPFISNLHTAASINVLGQSVHLERAYRIVFCLLGFSAMVLILRMSSRVQSFVRKISCRFTPSLPFNTTSPGRAHHSWKI